MRPSIKRALHLLLAVILVAAAIILYVTLVVPEYRAVASLRGALASREQTLDVQRVVISEVEKLIAEHQSLASLEETASLVLPHDERLASAVSHLAAIARVSGVRLASLNARPRPLRTSAQEGGVRKEVRQLEINFKLEGSYEGLRAFSALSENNVRLMDLEALAIDRRGRSTENVFSGTGVMIIYFQP